MTTDHLADVLARAEHDGCERCWYCDSPLAKRHEHDHVIPRRHGGEFVVPACMNCHELKDRTPLEQWDVAEVVQFIWSVPAGPQRVLWAKLVGLRMDLDGRESVSPSESG